MKKTPIINVGRDENALLRRWRSIKVACCLLMCLVQMPLHAFVNHEGSVLRLTLNNSSLKEVFNKIESQSEYTFLYNDTQINLNKKVSLDIESEEVADVLGLIFKGTNIKYQLVGNQIVLSTRSIANQSNKVTGTVTDANGEPLPGVNVFEKANPLNGVITGFDGKYTIEVSSSDAILTYSFIGFEKQDVSVTGRSAIDIVLVEETTGLDEVVVTALGIKREAKVLSYEVQKIDGAGIEKVKDANFVNALAGKVAGVTINSSAAGPGGSSRVIMRGNTSISHNNNALYVIDGVPIMSISADKGGIFNSAVSSDGIADFNPDDFESISVLSGASAAALYGSYAANGVVLITTKKAEKGKIKASLSNTTNFSKPFVTPRFQTKYGAKPGAFKSWGAELDTPSSYDPLNFFQTGSNVMNSLNLSVGGDKTQTYASIATTNSQGIIPNSDYNRYNLSIRNSSQLLNDKLSLDLGVQLIKTDNNNMITQGLYGNPLVPVYLFSPGNDFKAVQLYERYSVDRKFKTQFWPYGSQGIALQNPYWIANRQTSENKKDRYVLTANIKYDFFDWLNLQGRARYDNSTGEGEVKYHASTIELLAGSDKGLYGISHEKHEQTYLDCMVNVDKRFNDFTFNANVGASYWDSKYKSDELRGTLTTLANYFTINNLDLSNQSLKTPQSGYHDQVQSVFGNFEFGFQSKAYVTLAGRNDWQSMLAGTQTSSFAYYSVGLSGIVSEWLELPEFISFAKIRGSYAEVGSAPAHHLPFQQPEMDKGKLVPITTEPIDVLKDERTKSYELGLNLQLFNGKLDFNGTAYKTNTYNQTYLVMESGADGQEGEYLQAGNVQNKGVEAVMTYNAKVNDLAWSSSLVYSINENKIIELASDMKDQLMRQVGSYQMRNREGGELGDIYTTTRLREDNQGNIYVDPGSGKLSIANEDDQEGFARKVGSANPKYNLGWKNDLTYKNLSLGFLINARVGGVVVSATQAYMDSYGVSEQSMIDRDNGGIEVNKGMIDTEHYYSVVGNGNTGMSSHYVYSATNVRLQELVLSYKLPKKLLSNVVDGVTVSAVAKNVFMLYNKAPFDPELSPSTSTYYRGIDMFMQPSLRNIGFNVKINF